MTIGRMILGEVSVQTFSVGRDLVIRVDVARRNLDTAKWLRTGPSPMIEHRQTNRKGTLQLTTGHAPRPSHL